MSLDRLRRNFYTGDIALPSGECLDAEVIAALAEGSLDADSRAHALRHVAGCAACRRAVASVAGALVDGPITHEIEVVEGRRRNRGRILRTAVPLAAAALVLLWLWSPTDALAPHRGGNAGGDAQAPAALGPVGTVAVVHGFDWTRVTGSVVYRFTLFDASGVVLYETQVSDTTLALPDSVRLDASRPYLWKVQARTGIDRWTASELVEFTIARAPPPPK
jgi:hypothetical protein